MSRPVYCKPLWIGGGCRVETMKIAAAVLEHAAQDQKDPAVKMELLNMANSAHAEVTKAEHVPSWESLL